MKFNKNYFKGMFSGVILAMLLIGIISPTFAQTGFKTIDVIYKDIKLFVDGDLIKPMDRNGNAVTPFIYDGKTYLPIESLSDALSNGEKEVTWDRETDAIYIGEAPVAAQTDITELEPYEKNSIFIRNSKSDYLPIDVLDKEIVPFNKITRDGNVSYILDSKYSKIKGNFLIDYESIGSSRVDTITFYSISSKGDKTLLAEYEAEAADAPLAINVDLHGVNMLQIDKSESYGAFYNVVLEGLESASNENDNLEEFPSELLGVWHYDDKKFMSISRSDIVLVDLNRSSQMYGIPKLVIENIEGENKEITVNVQSVVDTGTDSIIKETALKFSIDNQSLVLTLPDGETGKFTKVY